MNTATFAAPVTSAEAAPPATWYSAAPIEYLDVAATAKLIRKALGAAFPGVKFAVRSSRYSGGASIDIEWVDGPTDKAASAIYGMYAAARFDGMIDMQYSVFHYLLPNGSVKIAYTSGSQGSGGVFPRIEEPMPLGARRVNFGSDYVHGSRRYSKAFLEAAAQIAARVYDIPLVEIADDQKYMAAHPIHQDDHPYLKGRSRWTPRDCHWPAEVVSYVARHMDGGTLQFDPRDH